MATKSKTNIKSDHFNSRLLWADLIRVLAIVLVLLIHSFIITSVESWSDLVKLVLFTTAKVAVPLFIMLSGALLLGKIESETAFFHKRVKRVLIPWVIWAGIFLIISGGVIVSSPLKTLAQLQNIFISQFSFLPALFCLYLTTPLFKMLLQRGGVKYGWYYVGLWFTAISVLPFFRNSLAFPVSADNGLVRQTVEYSGYFVVGWLLTKVSITRDRTIAAGITAVLCLIGTLILVQPRVADLQLIFLLYVAPLVVVGSISFFFWLFSILHSKTIPYNLPARWLVLLSQAVFGVFLIHNLVIQQLRQHTGTNPTLTTNIEVWVMTVVISFGIIIILRQIKVLRNLIS